MYNTYQGADLLLARYFYLIFTIISQNGNWFHKDESHRNSVLWVLLKRSECYGIEFLGSDFLILWKEYKYVNLVMAGESQISSQKQT